MALPRTNPGSHKYWGPPSVNDVGTTATVYAILAATGYSPSERLPQRGGRFGIHLIWPNTGAPNGSFSLQYSLMEMPDEADDNDWVTDTSVSVIGSSLTVAGAAGNTIIIAGNVPPGGWYRIKWTRTSGTLSVAAWSTDQDAT